MAIDKVNSNGIGTTEIWRSHWNTGWTSIVPFTLGGQPYLFEDKGDGTKTAIDKIRPGGTGSTEISERSDPLEAWLDKYCAVYLGRSALSI